MKLESQVVSRDWSEKLKKAGYPQEGIWWWVEDSGGDILPALKIRTGNMYLQHRYEYHYRNLRNKSLYKAKSAIVAPTSDEVLERLPYTLENGWSIKMYRFEKYRRQEETKEKVVFTKKIKWRVMYVDNSEHPHELKDDVTLANAAAKMWIYLKEKGLLDVQS